MKEIKVRLLVEKRYPAAWVFNFKPLQVGAIVPAVPASNLPGKGRYWINTAELRDDAYGILLEPGEYEIIPNRAKRNAARRAENAALRELCGTSARAAREDMGI